MIRRLFSRLHIRLLLLVLMSIAPAFVIVIHSSIEQRAQALAVAEQTALGIARSIVVRQHALMAQAHGVLGELAADRELRARLSERGCGEALAAAARRLPGQFSDLFAAGADGRVLCSMRPAPGRISVGDRSYFRRALETRAFSIGEFQRSRLSGKDTVFLAHPVFDDFGGVSAVLAAGLDLEWLGETLTISGLPSGSVLTLVDAAGTILVRIPDPEGLVGSKAPDLGHFPGYVEGEDQQMAETVWLDGVRRLTHVSPLYYGGGEGGLYIRTGIPRDAILGEIEATFQRNLLVLAATLLVALIVGGIASERMILRRVRDLADTARRLGQGELDARPGVPPDAGELGDLARAFRDMAEQIERREARIEHLATRDALTALPNRNLLLDRTHQALAQAVRSGQMVAMAVVNLDALKVVNDSLGHDSGDDLLLAVARKLCDALHEEDTVARVEGDDFVVLFPGIGSQDKAMLAVSRIGDLFLRPFHIRGHELHVTASIGAALFPADADSAQVLLHNAQAAMHRVKAHGGNGIQFYAAQMSVEAIERLRTEQALRRALDQDELELYFQPKVALADGTVSGVEALLRWRHPELGMVPPGRFIPIAEETGLILAIGEWVMDAACAAIAGWRAAGIRAPVVAINISPRQFAQGNVVEALAGALAYHGVEPAMIEVEVTETSIMRDVQATARTLAALRQLGVSVAIDDFGTGHSSLSQLRHLPLDKLKIDRAFVHDLPRDEGAALLARQIIAIAHALRLTVVAEGAETEAEIRFLLAHGCDEVQGYYFSRPLPEAELRDLLLSGRSWPVAVPA